MDEQAQPAKESSQAADRMTEVHIAEPVRANPKEPATAENLQKVERDMNSFERSTLRWTQATFGILAVTCLFIGFQWNEMRTGSKDTHDLAKAAKAQADNMINAADKIRQAAQDMVVQDKRIADNAKESFNASIRQSRASLDASIRSLQLDERPWVVASEFRLSEEPTLNKGITVTLSLANSGKTPAIQMEPQYKIGDSHSEPTFPDFPENPNFVSRAILAPGVTHLMFITNPVVYSTQAELDAYNTKASAIYIQAIIRYRATFGKAHWVKMCVSHVKDEALDNFNYCQTGNEVDGEKPN